MKGTFQGILFLCVVLVLALGIFYYFFFLRHPSSAPVSQTPLSLTDLKYILLKKYPLIHYCDPDHYPIEREEDMTLALRAYPTISAQTDVLESIARENNIANVSSLTDDEKLRIYTDYKKLERAIPLDAQGSSYSFQFMNEDNPADGKGTQIAGSINHYGAIQITKQEPGFATSCPICLSKNTRIATPDGDVLVQDVRVGMPVWTVDFSGHRVLGTVLRTGKTQVPKNHEIVHLILDDGRSVFVSPGHPTREGKAVGDLHLHDEVDGARVTGIHHISYSFLETYDLLTSGYKGMYLANGILLQSTLGLAGSSR